MNAIYSTNGTNGFWVFALVTLAIGGAAALATGRAIATTWRPAWYAASYALLLAAVVRFLQYALFQQPLLAPTNYLVDAAILVALALIGHRLARASQMTVQYPWAFERSGPLTWRRRENPSGSGGGTGDA